MFQKWPAKVQVRAVGAQLIVIISSAGAASNKCHGVNHYYNYYYYPTTHSPLLFGLGKLGRATDESHVTFDQDSIKETIVSRRLTTITFAYYNIEM